MAKTSRSLRKVKGICFIEVDIIEIKTTLPERTFQFSVRVVKLCIYIQSEHKNLRVLANQLLKSGTSIGANIEEGQAGQSKADFLAKYQIALKEARESSYWIRLLIATDQIPKSRLVELLAECEEIKKIIAASVLTGKKNKNK